MQTPPVGPLPHQITRQVIVMGVSGCGKSTIARSVASIAQWPFGEGDDFHPPANVAKMHAGTPLTDDDRWPWLRTIADWMRGEAAAGRSCVVTCSALKRAYRDLLGDRLPGICFVHLHGDRQVLHDRIAARSDHFMPSTLLQSQFDALEPLQPGESGVVLNVAADPDTLVSQALAWLTRTLVRPPVGG